MIKTLAIIFMLVDHLGAVLLSEMVGLRIIGRLALPLFAYQLALGLNYTSSFGRYFCRLFYFGLLSQIPYMYAFQTTELNILFTLSFSVASVYLLHCDSKYKAFYIFISLFVFVSLQNIYGLSYGLTCLYLVVVFHLIKSEFPFIQGDIMAALALIVIAVLSEELHLYSVFALPLFFLNGFDFRLNANKYFYYSLYPAHLVVLSLISFIGR